MTQATEPLIGHYVSGLFNNQWEYKGIYLNKNKTFVRRNDGRGYLLIPLDKVQDTGKASPKYLVAAMGATLNRSLKNNGR